MVVAGMFKTADTTKRVNTAIYPRDENFKISNNLETMIWAGLKAAKIII